MSIEYQDAKEWFKNKTEEQLKSKDINSIDILHVQRSYIAMLSEDCLLFKNLGHILKTMNL